MRIQVEEKVLSECGFNLSIQRAHATEYKNKEIIVYTVELKQLNLVINPEDIVYMKDYDCEKVHNSNLIAYPREVNKGQSPVHYGYRILFDDSLSLKAFLTNYLKYKEKCYF